MEVTGIYLKRVVVSCSFLAAFVVDASYTLPNRQIFAGQRIARSCAFFPKLLELRARVGMFWGESRRVSASPNHASFLAQGEFSHDSQHLVQSGCWRAFAGSAGIQRQRGLRWLALARFQWRLVRFVGRIVGLVQLGRFVRLVEFGWLVGLVQLRRVERFFGRFQRLVPPAPPQAVARFERFVGRIERLVFQRRLEWLFRRFERRNLLLRPGRS